MPRLRARSERAALLPIWLSQRAEVRSSGEAVSWPYGMLHGIRVIESLAAVERVRARVYPKRKAKSTRHWLRMDKKWRKRFGFREKPCMYKTGGEIVGEAFIVHPALMPQLRAALAAR